MNLLSMIDRLSMQGQGQSGKTLFLNMMPAKVNKAIMLRTPLTGTKIDHELPEYYKTEFQLIVRDTDYASAQTRAEDAVKALTVVETQIGPMYFRYCRPDTKPVAYPMSDGNLVEVSVTMCCCFNEDE